MLSMKLQPNYIVKQYMSRLVAKAYLQTYGVDYQETFTVVAKINSIHILISIATNQGWLLLQLDVKNAFLHRDLKEEIHMRWPLGFQYSTGIRKVKALYSLKQFPRA